jgi:hypothetical protein
MGSPKMKEIIADWLSFLDHSDLLQLDKLGDQDPTKLHA